MRISARDRQRLKWRKYQRWSEISHKAERRQALRDLFESCVDLAQCLIEAGVDPDRVKALERGVEVYEVLQEIGDTPELAEADRRLLAQNPMPPSGRLGPKQRRERDRRLAQKYADGEELDVTNCTLRQARIFCIARLSPEEWGLTPRAAEAPAPHPDPLPAVASDSRSPPAEGLAQNV